MHLQVRYVLLIFQKLFLRLLFLLIFSRYTVIPVTNNRWFTIKPSIRLSTSTMLSQTLPLSGLLLLYSRVFCVKISRISISSYWLFYLITSFFLLSIFINFTFLTSTFSTTRINRFSVERHQITWTCVGETPNELWLNMTHLNYLKNITCHAIMNSANLLTEHEIVTVQDNIHDFMYLRCNWPDVSINPKLHVGGTCSIYSKMVCRMWFLWWAC